MRPVERLWKNAAASGYPPGGVDSKEVGMAWEISAAANAVTSSTSLGEGDSPD